MKNAKQTDYSKPQKKKLLNQSKSRGAEKKPTTITTTYNSRAQAEKRYKKAVNLESKRIGNSADRPIQEYPSKYHSYHRTKDSNSGTGGGKVSQLSTQNFKNLKKKYLADYKPRKSPLVKESGRSKGQDDSGGTKNGRKQPERLGAEKGQKVANFQFHSAGKQKLGRSLANRSNRIGETRHAPGEGSNDGGSKKLEYEEDRASKEKKKIRSADGIKRRMHIDLRPQRIAGTGSELERDDLGPKNSDLKGFVAKTPFASVGTGSEHFMRRGDIFKAAGFDQSSLEGNRTDNGDYLGQEGSLQSLIQQASSAREESKKDPYLVGSVKEGQHGVNKPSKYSKSRSYLKVTKRGKNVIVMNNGTKEAPPPLPLDTFQSPNNSKNLNKSRQGKKSRKSGTTTNSYKTSVKIANQFYIENEQPQESSVHSKHVFQAKKEEFERSELLSQQTTNQESSLTPAEIQQLHPKSEHIARSISQSRQDFGSPSHTIDGGPDSRPQTHYKRESEEDDTASKVKKNKKSISQQRIDRRNLENLKRKYEGFFQKGSTFSKDINTAPNQDSGASIEPFSRGPEDTEDEGDKTILKGRENQQTTERNCSAKRCYDDNDEDPAEPGAVRRRNRSSSLEVDQLQKDLEDAVGLEDPGTKGSEKGKRGVRQGGARHPKRGRKNNGRARKIEEIIMQTKGSRNASLKGNSSNKTTLSSTQTNNGNNVSSLNSNSNKGANEGAGGKKRISPDHLASKMKRRGGRGQGNMTTNHLKATNKTSSNTSNNGAHAIRKEDPGLKSKQSRNRSRSKSSNSVSRNRSRKKLDHFLSKKREKKNQDLDSRIRKITAEKQKRQGEKKRSLSPFGKSGSGQGAFKEARADEAIQSQPSGPRTKGKGSNLSSKFGSTRDHAYPTGSKRAIRSKDSNTQTINTTKTKRTKKVRELALTEQAGETFRDPKDGYFDVKRQGYNPSSPAGSIRVIRKQREANGKAGSIHDDRRGSLGDQSPDRGSQYGDGAQSQLSNSRSRWRTRKKAGNAESTSNKHSNNNSQKPNQRAARGGGDSTSLSKKRNWRQETKKRTRNDNKSTSKKPKTKLFNKEKRASQKQQKSSTASPTGQVVDKPIKPGYARRKKVRLSQDQNNNRKRRDQEITRRHPEALSQGDNLETASGQLDLDDQKSEEMKTLKMLESMESDSNVDLKSTGAGSGSKAINKVLEWNLKLVNRNNMLRNQTLELQKELDLIVGHLSEIGFHEDLQNSDSRREHRLSQKPKNGEIGGDPSKTKNQQTNNVNQTGSQVEGGVPQDLNLDKTPVSTPTNPSSKTTVQQGASKAQAADQKVQNLGSSTNPVNPNEELKLKPSKKIKILIEATKKLKVAFDEVAYQKMEIENKHNESKNEIRVLKEMIIELQEANKHLRLAQAKSMRAAYHPHHQGLQNKAYRGRGRDKYPMEGTKYPKGDYLPYDPDLQGRDRFVKKSLAGRFYHSRIDEREHLMRRSREFEEERLTDLLAENKLKNNAYDYEEDDYHGGGAYGDMPQGRISDYSYNKDLDFEEGLTTDWGIGVVPEVGRASLETTERHRNSDSREELYGDSEVQRAPANSEVSAKRQNYIKNTDIDYYEEKILEAHLNEENGSPGHRQNRLERNGGPDGSSGAENRGQQPVVDFSKKRAGKSIYGDHRRRNLGQGVTVEGEGGVYDEYDSSENFDFKNEENRIRVIKEQSQDLINYLDDVITKETGDETPEQRDPGFGAQKTQTANIKSRSRGGAVVVQSGSLNQQTDQRGAPARIQGSTTQPPSHIYTAVSASDSEAESGVRRSTVNDETLILIQKTLKLFEESNIHLLSELKAKSEKMNYLETEVLRLKSRATHDSRGTAVHNSRIIDAGSNSEYMMNTSAGIGYYSGNQEHNTDQNNLNFNQSEDGTIPLYDNEQATEYINPGTGLRSMGSHRRNLSSNQHQGGKEGVSGYQNEERSLQQSLPVFQQNRETRDSRGNKKNNSAINANHEIKKAPQSDNLSVLGVGSTLSQHQMTPSHQHTIQQNMSDLVSPTSTKKSGNVGSSFVSVPNTNKKYIQTLEIERLEIENRWKKERLKVRELKRELKLLCEGKKRTLDKKFKKMLATPSEDLESRQLSESILSDLTAKNGGPSMVVVGPQAVLGAGPSFPNPSSFMEKNAPSLATPQCPIEPEYVDISPVTINTFNTDYRSLGPNGANGARIQGSVHVSGSPVNVSDLQGTVGNHPFITPPKNAITKREHEEKLGTRVNKYAYEDEFSRRARAQQEVTTGEDEQQEYDGGYTGDFRDGRGGRYYGNQYKPQLEVITEVNHSKTNFDSII